jgi:DNA polymerase-3 subunit epsilon
MPMTDEIITSKLPTIEGSEKPPRQHKLARERDLVFFDIETSGLIPGTHEILELAAVRLDINSLDEVAAFEARVLPRHIETATPEALVINGYSAELWNKTAFSLTHALKSFVEICNDHVTLVAHNPVFDWAFVRPALAEFDLLAKVDYHVIDTASLAWPIAMSGAIDRVKLQVVCDHLGISNEGEHRALADCRRAAEAYRRMMRMYDWNEVHARTSVPLIDAAKRLRDIWESVKKGRQPRSGSRHETNIHDEEDVLACVGQIVLPALKAMEEARHAHAASRKTMAMRTKGAKS